jgi:hypothetical protein
MQTIGFGGQASLPAGSACRLVPIHPYFCGIPTSQTKGIFIRQKYRNIVTGFQQHRPRIRQYQNYHSEEKDGFLLPYIEIELAGEARLPMDHITVAPKNHVDLARKGMMQYLDQLGYRIPVELSHLKLRY